jgi:hypothetical protein
MKGEALDGDGAVVLYFLDARAPVETPLFGKEPPVDAHRNATAHPRHGL